MARKRKYSDEVLISILKMYIKENPYTPKLKFTSLASYANDIGYSDIIYQDFFRNKKLNEIIKEYNSRRSMDSLSDIDSDNLVHHDFSVEAIVEKNYKDKKQLKAVLKIYKVAYDNIFKRAEHLENELEKRDSYIKETEKMLLEQQEKIKKLKSDINELKAKNHEIKLNKKNESILSLIKYIVDTKNIVITDESDVAEIIKNFNDRTDIKNDTVTNSEVLKEATIEKQLNNNTYITNINADESAKVISFENKKTKLKMPDFMK